MAGSKDTKITPAMATTTLSRSAAFTVFIFSLFLFTTTVATTENSDHTFGKSLNPESITSQKQKLSHFRFFFHDIGTGKSPTSINIVRPPPTLNTSATGFGFINMIDDPLTIGPELSSKLVGRAQGLYGCASQEELALLMTMNFAFVEGKYNGSTITVMGRNPIFNAVREMPVIGGSGLFRFARGYAQAKTHTFDLKTGDAVVEYNVFVMHY